MDIESTNIAAVDPERGAISVANAAASKGDFLEGEFVGVVYDVAEVVGELGAEWVDVEVAEIAHVGDAGDGFATDVTDRTVVVGIEIEMEWVVVEGGGEVWGAIGAVHVDVGDADKAAEPVAEAGGVAGGADVIGLVVGVVNQMVVGMDVGELGFHVGCRRTHFSPIRTLIPNAEVYTL